MSENLLSDHLTCLIAENIACSYELLDNLPTSEPTESFQIPTKSFSAEEYAKHKDGVYLSPLLQIYEVVKNELDSYIDAFYLHGSLATMDYVKGWSDIDTFMVLSKETVTNKSSLLKVRTILGKIHDLMKKISPLQHHGVMVSTAIDLKSYPESFLPLKVFEQMKIMVGKDKVISGYVKKATPDFELLESTLGFLIKTAEKGIFEHHAFDNEYLLAEYQNADNAMYQFKYYLEQFTLLPCLYLTAIRQSCYKKESFQKSQEIFSLVVLEWIGLISGLRKKWGQVTGENYTPNKIPTWVKDEIPPNYFEIGAKVAKNLLNHIEKTKSIEYVSE